MNSINKSGADFVGYEYKQIAVPAARAARYLDGYRSFGWQADEGRDDAAPGDANLPGGTVRLRLRRDRGIVNRTELTRLERNFEASMEEIDTLESKKAQRPRIAVLSIGVLGTAFLAASIFTVTAAVPRIWLCALLAVPGITGWTLPCLLYKRLKQKMAALFTPLIEQKYAEIRALCTKGSSLAKK